MTVKLFDKLAENKGLVLNYPLWDSSLSGAATILDRSKNRYHGTNTGSTLVVGLGRNFVPNSKIQVPNTSGLFGIVQPSISAWIFPTNTNVEEIIELSWPGADPNDRGYELSRQADKKIRFSLHDGVNADTLLLTSVGIAETNQWSYVGGSFDGATSSIQINGKIDVTAPWAHSIASALGFGQGNIGIGYDGAVRAFTGTIGEVRFYNVALSPFAWQRIYLENKWRYV